MPRSLEGLEVSKLVKISTLCIYVKLLFSFLYIANASQEPATVTIMLSYMC